MQNKALVLCNWVGAYVYGCFVKLGPQQLRVTQQSPQVSHSTSHNIDMFNTFKLCSCKLQFNIDTTSLSP